MRQLILIFVSAAMLAGCSDPLRDVPRLSEVEEDTSAGHADALPTQEDGQPEQGFLSGLFAPNTETVDPAPQAGDMETASGQAPEAPPEQAAEETTETAPAPRGGLFGFLKPRASQQPAPENTDRQTAALTTASDAPRGSGPAPDYAQAGPAETLPFGQMARACGLPERVLGKKIASYPERGRGYTLYDSAPGSTAARTMFLTGFDDGCARQFTGALAMFAAPEMHEQLRYGLPSETIPYSIVDEAYEVVKSQVCRVGKGKPCGRGLPRLARNTAFVTVYPDFGASRYANMLLHDGDVLAFAE